MIPIQAAACTEARLLSRCRHAHTIVRLHGDIDIASSAVLRKRLRNTLQRCMDLLILDLSEVSFCDASGLAVLVGIRRRASRLGVTLRVASPRPSTARLLRITGLDRSLTIHPTLSSALASKNHDPTIRQGSASTSSPGDGSPRFRGRFSTSASQSIRWTTWQKIS
ncbi:STAS domain-containing protein [Streptosporangium sp. NPDC000396]|uniref:STAS domain-containing protein n=1 Tax=Streptosporangium sp. NPDC000396 TaxID=3366185 RepID=UPI003686B26C